MYKESSVTEGSLWYVQLKPRGEVVTVSILHKTPKTVLLKEISGGNDFGFIFDPKRYLISDLTFIELVDENDTHPLKLGIEKSDNLTE